MLVTLHVWRVPPHRLGAAFLRMATEPRRIRALPGVRFVKLVGTGAGRTFNLNDADLTRYAAVVVWDGDGRPDDVDRPWAGIAVQRARVAVTPVASRGRWSGVAPFGTPAPHRTTGPVLALTRARLRPSRMLTFWRAVPPVAREVATAPGLLARFGFGEAPIGWQGTVSLWRDAADLTAFAYRQPEHRAVIARTPSDRWYAEELFARFAVLDVSGDRGVLGWREGGLADR
ncbi:MAG TPA: monooxygenase [Actinoplanes sp.]|jgi:hypothetical protein